MPVTALAETAQELVGHARGILAIDESVPTISKRFDALVIESTEETRRTYRELLVNTQDLSGFVSGVILYDETIRQQASDGRPLPDALVDLGIMPGIKVDTGTKPLAGHPHELVTEGLDGLRSRLEEYRELGARFAKWRAVISIGPDLPSPTCVAVNAHALARYAALCQEAGLVPIVEPEVLMEGDHPLERCFDVTRAVLRRVFAELAEQGVALEGIVLKPSMVLPGSDSSETATHEDVAQATLRCLLETCPAAVPGVAFLSGGQGAELATAHLQAMNASGPSPWALTFSYGRALQDPALRTWAGSAENVDASQAALAHRARCNSAAAAGRYSPDMEAASGTVTETVVPRPERDDTSSRPPASSARSRMPATP